VAVVRFVGGFGVFGLFAVVGVVATIQCGSVCGARGWAEWVRGGSRSSDEGIDVVAGDLDVVAGDLFCDESIKPFIRGVGLLIFLGTVQMMARMQ